jgi:hypothetical protein
MSSNSTESTSETAETDRLFELIESKLHLLTEMRHMTVAQADVVAQHDVASLMMLLSGSKA